MTQMITLEKLPKKMGQSYNRRGPPGCAMLKGLKTAAKSKCDCIISMDSDGQVDANEITIFANHIKNDEADLIIGSRFMDKNLVKYRYRGINKFGVIVLSWILSKLT